MGKYPRTYTVAVVIVIPLLVGVLSTVASLATSFSRVGGIAALGVVLAAIVVAAIWLRPVVVTTPSGHRLLEALRLEGLEDEISRDGCNCPSHKRLLSRQSIQDAPLGVSAGSGRA